MEQSPDTQLVIEVTRAIIEKAAPDEMILFPSISAAYAQEPERILQPQKASDQAGSFGVELLVEHVTIFCMYLVHQAIVHHLLQTAADEGMSKAVDATGKGLWAGLTRIFKRKPAQTVSAPPTELQNTSHLTPEILARVHAKILEIALKKAPEYHISNKKAEEFSKLVIAELILAEASTQDGSK